ncbi:MAG: DUF2868 domain-containing protein [Holophagales bacterium]|nr:DUF2868 domain-containing protein [Holophagales bacterium]
MTRQTATSLRPRAEDARAVLLVWSVEEEDRAGRLLPLDSRSRATREALGDDADSKPELWLPARARCLLGELASSFPASESLLRHGDPAVGWTAPAVVGAFVLGLATNGTLLTERPINVMAPPLLGLVAWNVVVCLLALVRPLLLARLPAVPAQAGGKVNPWIRAFFERFVRRLPEALFGGGRRGGSSGEGGAGDGHAVETAAARRFLGAWLGAGSPLATARIRRLLHLGARAAVAGALFGLYVRGIAFEYRAVWESTFLDVSSADLLLGTVLAPAAWALGSEVPSVQALAAPDGANAGPWIHLWAMTALLFVGLPRLGLISWESLALARHARRLEIEVPAAYLRRLRASASTATHDVQVLPYSHRPAEPSARALRGLLLDLVGARARIRLAEPLAYGAELPGAFPGRLRAVLFSLVHTPEVEVHGDLLRHLRQERVDGQGLLVLVDEAAFRRRSGEKGESLEERLESRRRAWRRVVADAGLEPTFVDSSDPGSGDLERLAAGVWPAETRFAEGA